MIDAGFFDAARCTPAQTNMFIDERPESVAYAKAVCRHCPVQQRCLDTYFLDRDVIVGGTTWAERRAMLYNGDYSDRVAAKLRGILGGARGMIAATAIGLRAEELRMLRARHDIAA